MVGLQEKAWVLYALHRYCGDPDHSYRLLCALLELTATMGLGLNLGTTGVTQIIHQFFPQAQGLFVLTGTKPICVGRW